MAVRHLFFLLNLGFLSGLRAQDGGQLYGQYCSACHGLDGRGGAASQFPTLAGSEWVGGAPQRAIKVVLAGLHGPVEVAGKSYDLEMPPQGAALTDAQVAAILSYVRSSWGNDAGKVEEKDVTKVRAETAGRSVQWTAQELLKAHPLPRVSSGLSDLVLRSYPGPWQWMPELSSLPEVEPQQVPSGVIDEKDSSFEDHFVALWEGELEVAEAGVHEIILDADDGAILWLDGKQILDVGGEGALNGSRATRCKMILAKGKHKLRAALLEVKGEQGIALGWRNNENTSFRWLTARKSAAGDYHDAIPIGPKVGRPVVYRNFIDGTTPRAIGVGFEGGLNLAWSADHLGPELLWTGKFIDGAAKWVDRGIRPSPPVGENIVRISSAKLLPESARFGGYDLDAQGNPTLVIHLGSQTLRDGWKVGTSDKGEKCLIRTLELMGGDSALWVPLGKHVRIDHSAKVAEQDGMPGVKMQPMEKQVFYYLLP